MNIFLFFLFLTISAYAQTEYPMLYSYSQSTEDAPPGEKFERTCKIFSNRIEVSLIDHTGAHGAGGMIQADPKWKSLIKRAAKGRVFTYKTPAGSGNEVFIAHRDRQRIGLQGRGDDGKAFRNFSPSAKALIKIIQENCNIL